MPWQERRANLLVDGLDLPQVAGVTAADRRRDVVLEITGESDPCERMDAVAPGLCAALTPGLARRGVHPVMAGGGSRSVMRSGSSAN